MSLRLLNDFLSHFKRIAAPARGEDTDGELVERFARQRDESAFATLVRRHGPLVLGVSRRMLHDDQDAEDVFQATFLILARQASLRRWQPSIAGWLYCVAYRLALRTGAQGVRRRRLERQAGGSLRATATEGRTELYAVLDEELQQLADPYREPLVLCHLEGKTRDQAAQQLGWSLRTLERRLHQGLKLLRARLERRGVQVPAALLATALSQQAASAALSAAVVAATVEAGMLCGTGAEAGHLVSTRVAALVEEGPRAWAMARITVGALVLVAVSALAALVGMAQQGQPDTKKPPAPPAAQNVQQNATRPAAALWPEGTTVTGRVVDHAGAPVVHAEVLLLGPERVIVEANRTWFVLGKANESPKLSVRTNARGEFSIARQQGAANRLLVIAEAPLFWTLSRKDLAAGDAVEIKLPPAGSLAINCTLPGKAAKQPVMIELQGAEEDSDFLRFHSGSYTVPNPGEKVFENLPPGRYVVQRSIETPTGKNSISMTMADRQLVKVEAGKRATLRLERLGRPLTGQVRGLENVELRYGLVTIRGWGPEETFANRKPRRMTTAFDVLPITSAGRFTTDPLPPGKYFADIFVVRATTLEQSNQQSDFEGQLSFTVPEQGAPPTIEILAKPNTRPRSPSRDPRVRVLDETSKPVPAFQAMLHSHHGGYTLWSDGRDGMVGYNDPLLWKQAEVVDVLVRAEGYASSVMRFAGKDREKLRQGDASLTLQRGAPVEIRFRLPEGMSWPKDVLPEAYFGDYEERVRMMRQPGNRRHATPDFNMLNLRAAGAGRFSCRIARETPPFHVAIHAPGFLQYFEAGPFTLADAKEGVLAIDVPRPAEFDIRFDPGVKAEQLPFMSVTLEVMRQIEGNSYLDVATDQSAATKHELRLADLAPGNYLVSVRTQPAAEVKQVPGTEINPGAYFDRRKPTLAAGERSRIALGYTPFNPDAFRGQRTARVRIRLPDGMPAKGKRVTIECFDGHYGSLAVFAGSVPDSGELVLEGITDRLPSEHPEKMYTVSVDDRRVGQFGFTNAQKAPEFEFRLAPQAGDLAPDVELLHPATGKPVRLSSLRGKVVFLEFWSTWCGPCQPALAKLNTLVAEQPAAWKDHVVILPVSIDVSPDRVGNHCQRRGLSLLDPYWSGQDGGREFDAPAARAFVVNGVPEAMLIGPDGRIVWRGHPLDASGGQDLKARIDAVLRKLK